MAIIRCWRRCCCLIFRGDLSRSGELKVWTSHLQLRRERCISHWGEHGALTTESWGRQSSFTAVILSLRSWSVPLPLTSPALRCPQQRALLAAKAPHLIMESEFDLDLEKGEPLLLELFLAQMMSWMCWATNSMATGRKAALKIERRDKKTADRKTNGVHFEIAKTVRTGRWKVQYSASLIYTTRNLFSYCLRSAVCSDELILARTKSFI